MKIGIKKNKSSIPSNYRPEINGLRAFAIVTVIINHFNQDILPSGYLGVDIFFCISGFVITSSLNQFSNKNIKDFITKFYVRRIKRLLPALSVFVVISSIAICLFNPEPSRTLVTGLTSLFGFSNLYLLKLSTNYFAQSTQLNLFTHTWSLGVEQQFYILFPFLVWFTGFGRYTKNGSRNLFLVIGVLTIGSLISFVTLYSNNQEAAYFLMPTRLWEMGAGSLLFIGLQKKGAIKKLFEKAPPIIILMLIIVVMCLPISWAVVSTILVVIFTSILIGSLRNSSLLFKVFTHPKIIYIGLISYSLYLWHWSVLSISRWTFGIYWWSIPLQLALIIGLAIASYEWIETPLRDGSWVTKKLHTLSVGLGILITISLNFGVAPQNNFGILTNLLRGKGIFGNQLITKVSFLMHKFQKKLYTGNQYNKWKMKHFGEKIIMNNPKISTIYLIGDSHSAHYGAAFTHLVAEKKHNLIMHPRGEGLRLTKEVAGQEDYILAPLRRYKNKFKKGDIIVFSARVDKYSKMNNYTKHFDTFIKKTKHIGLQYNLISPTPTNFPDVQGGYICQEEWYRPLWAISPKCYSKIKKTEWLAFYDSNLKSIKEFLLKNPKISYIDTFSVICPEIFCKNFDENSIMYRGENHLNSYGAMKLLDTIKSII